MITPMDIHNKTFSRGLRGYSQEEVDAFLQELASDYERIYREPVSYTHLTLPTT